MTRLQLSFCLLEKVISNPSVTFPYASISSTEVTTLPGHEGDEATGKPPCKFKGLFIASITPRSDTLVVAGHEDHAFNSGCVHKLNQAFGRHVAIQMSMSINDRQNIRIDWIVSRF